MKLKVKVKKNATGKKEKSKRRSGAGAFGWKSDVLQSASSGKKKWLTLKENESAFIRFLSTEPYAIRRHNLYNLGKKGWLTCPGEDNCPLHDRGDNGSIRTFFNVWIYTGDFKEGERDGHVAVFELAPKFVDVLLTEALESVEDAEDSPYANKVGRELTIADFDVRVKKIGSGTDTTYSFRFAKKPCKMTMEQKEAEVTDLEEYLGSVTREQMEQRLFGNDAGKGGKGKSKKDDDEAFDEEEFDEV